MDPDSNALSFVYGTGLGRNGISSAMPHGVIKPQCTWIRLNTERIPEWFVYYKIIRQMAANTIRLEIVVYTPQAPLSGHSCSAL